MALIYTLLLFNHVVEKQKSCWKPKERTTAKGSGKNGFTPANYNSLQCILCLKSCDYTHYLQEILKNTGVLRFISQWGGDERTN